MNALEICDYGERSRELGSPGGSWRWLTVLWGCPGALHEDCERCINSSRHPLEELTRVSLIPSLDR